MNIRQPAVSLRQVRKRFGSFTAIRELSVDIADNEFFTLLGPSGCGKTTLLRMIAGFENTSGGEIFLYGEPIATLPPDKRPINTVFQSYALFPHMNVAENIGFGLQMLGWAPQEIQKRTEHMIRTVRLEEFAQRSPSQLSGGQQQRVALARAMAPKPKVLLLDEPLSALDLKLRQQMRDELKFLQKETGITFIFVTHDQEEALSMSDRIAVMSNGEIQQTGTPTEIYEHPENRFIADFIGQTNLLDVSAGQINGLSVECALSNGSKLMATSRNPVTTGSRGYVSLRPEKMTLHADSASTTGLPATVASSVYLGTDRQIQVSLDDATLLSIRLQNTGSDNPEFNSGDRVRVGIAEGAARFLTN